MSYCLCVARTCRPARRLGAEYVKALYAKAAAERRPMPKATPEALGMWGGEIFIFPNFMILPHAGNAMMYRARPAGPDPDRCIFEIYSTKSYPAAVTPPRADGSTRDRHRRSAASAAHSATGSGQHSAHAKGSALKVHAPDMARQ